MPFTRHYLERGPDYWIYKNPDVRYYIYGNPNKIYFEPCKNYPHDNVHYVYLYNLLLNNSRVGPLANKTLAYHYLKYLLTSRCVFSYNTKPLLTVLFNRMGLIPITIYWKRFEDILEEMAKYDDRISTLWDGYDYMRSYPATDIRNVPNATADYFIYYKEGKPVEQYSLEDIQNAPLMFYMRPLPARRPTSFEYSIKELSDGAYLYRNTFVYYPVFKNMPITDVLDEDTLLVKRISEGECDLEYDEIQRLAVMLTEDECVDADIDSMHNVISVEYENKFVTTLNKLRINLNSQQFRNIEANMKKHYDLLPVWLNWNYMDGVHEAVYFSALYYCN